MRVLLVSAYGLPHMGGIEVATDALATGLAERGHRITHVTSDTGPGENEPGRGYERIAVPVRNSLESRLGVPFPLFHPKLLTVLRREIEKADLVHAHGYIYPGSVVAAALCRRTSPRTPLVLTEHVGHVPYESRFLDGLERVVISRVGLGVLRRTDAVVTYNDRVAGQLEALCPSISRTTILNGVDSDRFRPPVEGERDRLRADLGWEGRHQVLFVGRPVAKKGFPTAVRAVADSGLPDVHLAVAGADRLPQETPSQVESLGRLSRFRLAEVYRACDALIVPARGEGFPLSAQEALASGLPLLLADDPGYAPNLAGAGTAVRSVRGSHGFGRALAELLGDSAGLEDARRAAAAHARRAFSWHQAIDEHEALYRQLAAQPS